jgi:hypothetical protein
MSASYKVPGIRRTASNEIRLNHPGSSCVFSRGVCLTYFAQESRWGSPNEETVKFIIAAEAKWANSACSSQPDLKDVIADDFQATSPSGRRYDKAKAITADTKSLSRDCQLGEVKVRFFGDSIAIAYGAESAVSKAKDGKETKRCLIWTDTWLKRARKWQIVAAQDTDCLVTLRRSR